MICHIILQCSLQLYTLQKSWNNFWRISSCFPMEKKVLCKLLLVLDPFFSVIYFSLQVWNAKLVNPGNISRRTGPKSWRDFSLLQQLSHSIHNVADYCLWLHFYAIHSLLKREISKKLECLIVSWIWWTERSDISPAYSWLSPKGYCPCLYKSFEISIRRKISLVSNTFSFISFPLNPTLSLNHSSK